MAAAASFSLSVACTCDVGTLGKFDLLSGVASPLFFRNESTGISPAKQTTARAALLAKSDDRFEKID